jgi:hypothetical protein
MVFGMIRSFTVMWNHPIVDLDIAGSTLSERRLQEHHFRGCEYQSNSKVEKPLPAVVRVQINPAILHLGLLWVKAVRTLTFTPPLHRGEEAS